MQKINKSFGANRVLREVDFSLATGEICALLGELCIKRAGEKIRQRKEGDGHGQGG